MKLFDDFAVIYSVEQDDNFKVFISSLLFYHLVIGEQQGAITGRAIGVYSKERQFTMTSVYITAVLIGILFAAMSFIGLETNP